MLTAILLDNGESNVVSMTYQDVERQLVKIPHTKLIVSKDFDTILEEVKTPFVCLLEPDCLLSPKYFTILINHLRKHSSRNITIDSAVTSVGHWNNKFYGYTCGTMKFGNRVISAIHPQKNFKSHSPYPVQIAYIPGALIRMNDLRRAIKDVDLDVSNLVRLSVDLSLYFWDNKGRVYIHPSVDYVTTEEYVGLTHEFKEVPNNLKKLFTQQAI